MMQTIMWNHGRPDIQRQTILIKNSGNDIVLDMQFSLLLWV